MKHHARDPQDASWAPRPWLVLKFGGTSVSTLERWRTIAATVEKRVEGGYRPVLVCSALSQVSNRLEALLEEAERGLEVAPGIAELKTVHAKLARAMELDAEEHLSGLFQELKDLLEGVRLTGEATPRVRARVMSCGELLSTRLGAAWLNERGIAASWQDARELLVAWDDGGPLTSPERRYLSATCPHEPDAELEERLRGLPAEVIVTQGFLARLPGGDTVLLGRGGSDTAAAYFAAKLGAEHLEIWTDVPGLFTANPRQVPDARLLRSLGYAEAEELASKGAKVLHPRCIRPAREGGIPIHVRCTPVPEMRGTVISPDPASETPGIKAVSMRKGIVLVSMEVEGDWQPVGVIADIATCFKDHGLSIDLLASSHTNLTVALDPAANRLDDEVLEPLLEALRPLCDPEIIRPAAAVSLVGSGIRAILHEWAPVLQCFEDEQVYLVAQAANDLSLTFVVNETGAGSLVRTLHDELFDEDLPPEAFGPPWETLVERAGSQQVTVS